MKADDLHCYESTKTYVHALGLSCCFRQWKTESHCRMLHGYALEVKIVFGCSELDQNNWAMDFGGLKPVKLWLENTFDHKLLVARDDPNLNTLIALESVGLARVILVDSVGIESFARQIFLYTHQWLFDEGYFNRIWVESVEVSEHEANSAIYRRKHTT